MWVIIIYYLIHIKHSCILAWKPLTVFTKKLHHRCSAGFLCCVSYLALFMVMAALASCGQVIFKISLYVLFQYVCVYFVKLETEFREIIHSWKINEITCLNERIFFSCTLFIYYFFSFQQKLHQSTNTYNYHGNDSTVGRSSCTNPDESFRYYDSNDVVVVI